MVKAIKPVISWLVRSSPSGALHCAAALIKQKGCHPMSRMFSLRPALNQANAAWMVGGGLLLAAWNVQAADVADTAEPSVEKPVETAQLETTDRIETAQLGNNPLPAEAAAVAEVVITARRREERLQDVPLSISAVSGEFVQEQNLTRIREFAARIPNFNPDTSNPRTSSLSIRGVGASAAAATAPSRVSARSSTTSSTRTSASAGHRSTISRASKWRAARRARCSARTPRSAP